MMDVAVVGHTNTGKTSLMRTLTRRRDFGQVSSRAATTRHVEMAELAVAGEPILRLYDTPGLEDSSGLLAHLDDLRADHGSDWTDAIDAFIARRDLQAGFTQEAKALAQVRAANVALYVIDARDKVRARHRDELEVLGRCAVPILPVLNFVASGSAREAEWRGQLARVNMHAVIAFDTVVFDERGERALYDRIATLADRFAPLLKRLSEELAARRRQLRRASAVTIADMLVDAAAAARPYTLDDDRSQQAAVDELKAAVRAREAACLRTLLDLHGFAEDDARLADLAIRHGHWSDDPFDPETLQRFGISAGTAAATGAAAGVAIDLVAGGITLGAAAATGAALGFLFDTARRFGGQIADRLSGIAAVRVDEPTLVLLAERECALMAALLKRGHGAVAPIETLAEDQGARGKQIVRLLSPAKAQPEWSAATAGADARLGSARRKALVDEVAGRIEDLCC